MKHPFKRVIILLNDLENMEVLLEKGATFANEHHALLEVLFVHEVPLFEIPNYFLSDEKISKSTLDKEKVKEQIECYLEDLNFAKEHVIFVYNNDTVDRLSTLLNNNTKEALVLTQYHQELSSELVEKTPFSFWIIKEDKTYENVAFPIDLEDKFKPSMSLMKHLFPQTKIELIHDYRYMLDPVVTSQDYLIVAPVSTEVDMELNRVVREKKIKIFNDYLEEYQLKGTFLEGEGVFNNDLIQYIEENNFDLTVLHRDNDEIFFTPTLIQELMEEVSTDFFVS